MNQILNIAVIILYVFIMLGVGYWSMRRTKNVGDFFLGGRTLGPWMSAFAYGTTYFSAVLFIGYAGKLGWGFGIHTMWIVLGNTLIGTFLAWKLLAGRTHEMTVRLKALTMPEFLRTRYDSKSMQVIAALVVFIFLVPYSASVYMGLSYLFEKALGFQYNEALFFLAGLTGIYLVMGGYLAVAISDFIRGIVEFAGVMIMVFLLAEWKGGFVTTASELMGNTKVMAPGLAKTIPLGPEGWQILVPGSIILISLILVTSFGPMALPQMVQKFYSIRGRADVIRAMTIAGIFAFFMTFGAYYSGALTHLYYADGFPQAIISNGIPNLDQLMPHFITTHFPYGFVLLILLLVFSASMSSLSSLVLVSSSAIAIDIYGAFVNRHVNQKQIMFLMRLLCALFVALSLMLAMYKVDVIVNLMVMSWGALAGVFLAPYIYGLFWKRTTKAGAFAGIAAGLASAFALFMLWGKDGIPLAGAITMFLPLFVVPLVSLITRPLPRQVVDAAFGDSEAKQEAVVSAGRP
ncbi:MAG TPA: sodium:solute symporter [Nitrospirota bacterium]|nr:sodium:solute symporter [Nitrospirota bacterium]